MSRQNIARLHTESRLNERITPRGSHQRLLQQNRHKADIPRRVPVHGGPGRSSWPRHASNDGWLPRRPPVSRNSRARAILVVIEREGLHPRQPAPYHLNSDSLPSAFCQDDVAFPRAAAWEGCRGVSMPEVLNEVDRGESDQFAPSSDIVLGDAVSQKNTPSSSALKDRDRRYELRAQQSLTAAFFGDPLPGRSALDRQRAEQERIARRSEA